MPHQDLNARKAIVSQDNVTVNSGSNYGFHRVGNYRSFTGTAYAVGSMAVRLQSQMSQTGPVLASSVWNVSSGANFLSVPNRAPFITVDVTIAQSGGVTGSILLIGEPLS